MFLEVQLPVGIAYGSAGGPTWNTSVVTVDSGYEQRNQPWAEDLGQWDLGSYVQTQADAALLLAFFNRVQGKTHTWRFKDWKDYQMGPQQIGVGDGTQATFQLYKTYDPQPGAYMKVIKKPVAGTVTVTVAGAPRTEGTDYTLDTTTGRMTFLEGHIPTAGQQVGASCEFDKPCRFDLDHLAISYATIEFGSLHVPVIEVRLP